MKDTILVISLIFDIILAILSFLYILDNFNQGKPVDSRIWALFWFTVVIGLAKLICSLKSSFKPKPKRWEKDL